MRFFLLDTVCDLELGKSATALKCISLTDEVLHDHFPNHPVYPGVLLAEGLAQLGGFLLEVSVNRGVVTIPRRAVMLRIDRMSFLGAVTPGDRLIFKATITALSEDGAKIEVEALNDPSSLHGGSSEARAKGTITYGFTEIDDPELSAQRVRTYRTWTKTLKMPLELR